ncbi:DUF2130 domain-containing protein [Candidatus Amesbacteria bacterium]|nr:DUF2130 domain-containing protein [Candidatus Amesbacteria bacterium]
MDKTMVCPKCGEEMEMSEVFRHEIEEKVKGVEEAGRKKERELLEQMREMKREDREREVEFEKKMMQAEEKIWVESRKKAAAEQDLKQAELKKQLEEALKMNKDLEQKLQQGSQQTQGEVLELQLEQMLKKEFPGDLISEVAKGVRGADVVQEVYEKTGKKTGVILWESKNAKWSYGWIDKLREDMRRLNANEAVLISVELPEEIKNFTFYKGVWVSGRGSAVGLAWALRKNLWEVFKQSKQNEGKKEKAEEVYDYVNSVDFAHRVESIVEAFNILNEDLEREKRWFAQKWARQEKEMRKIMDNTHGMYGELQGVTGRSLPEIKALEQGE